MAEPYKLTDGARHPAIEPEFPAADQQNINFDRATDEPGGPMRKSPRSIVWIGTLIAAAIASIGCALEGFGLAPGSWPLIAASCGAAAIFLTRDPASFSIGESWLRLLECVVLFTLISSLGAVLSYLVMMHSGAYTDSLLDGLDRSLGFNWLAIHREVLQHHWLTSLMIKSYLACFWLPFVVLGLLFSAGEADRMYRFLLAFGLSLGLTVIVFYFFPARAAFEFYLGKSHVPGYDVAITGLRDGTYRTIDFQALEGIITFPSFHAAMAVLFGWAVWPSRWFRAPLAVINTLMFLSAVPVGGHYVVDLFGGALIAILSIEIARRTGRSNLARQSVSQGNEVIPRPIVA